MVNKEVAEHPQTDRVPILTRHVCHIDYVTESGTDRSLLNVQDSDVRGRLTLLGPLSREPWPRGVDQ